jgi:adenylate cyclase
VFTYKGKAVSVQQVGRELGVRYVLEGSIQTSGDRVRVTAQLIEATTNVHVWSDRYDRDLDDIFEIQSEVTEKIAAALAGTSGALAVAERATVRRKPPASLQAYDYYVLGQELQYRNTKEDTPKAEQPLKKTNELDPQFVRAHVALGHLYNSMAFWGWGNEDADTLLEKSNAALSKAIVLDPTDAFAHAVLGLNYLGQSDYDHGVAECEKALALNPNDPDVLVKCGGSLHVTGRAREGADMVNRAYRLNPHFHGAHVQRVWRYPGPADVGALPRRCAQGRPARLRHARRTTEISEDDAFGRLRHQAGDELTAAPSYTPAKMVHEPATRRLKGLSPTSHGKAGSPSPSSMRRSASCAQ